MAKPQPDHDRRSKLYKRGNISKPQPNHHSNAQKRQHLTTTRKTTMEAVGRLQQSTIMLAEDKRDLTRMFSGPGALFKTNNYCVLYNIIGEYDLSALAGNPPRRNKVVPSLLRGPNRIDWVAIFHACTYPFYSILHRRNVPTCGLSFYQLVVLCSYIHWVLISEHS